MKSSELLDCILQEKQEFKSRVLKFSTTRKFKNYRRILITSDNLKVEELLKKYFNLCKNMIDTTKKKKQIMLLLST